VSECGSDNQSEVVLSRDVVDGIVDQHSVKGPREPHRAHVATQMPAFWVEPPGYRQHVVRDVNECEREAAL
jgi:hypothetical protein